MESTIIVNRSILVKVIVNDWFQKKVSDNIHNQILSIDSQIKDVNSRAEFMIRELQLMDKISDIPKVENDLQQYTQMLYNQWSDALAKLEEINRLPKNSEYVTHTITGPVEISVGDDFIKKAESAEIIIKDSKVIDIRNCNQDLINIVGNKDKKSIFSSILNLF